MQVAIDTIGDYPLLDIDHLSDSMIRFRIDATKAYKQKIAELEMLFFSRDTCNDYRHALTALNLKERRTDWQHLVLDMKLLLLADFYYTNGQEVFLLLKEEKGWKVGKIKSIYHFADSRYLFDPEHLSYLTALDLPAFPIFESAEFYIIEQLEKIQVLRLPLDNGTGIFIRMLYPNHLRVDFGNGSSRLFTTDSYDWASQEMEKQTAPHRLRTCLNCRNFQFSGMSHSMSSGSKGYCFLIKEQLERITPDTFPQQAITHIWNWCSGFEARN